MGVFPVRNNQIKVIKACRRARIFCAFWFGANGAVLWCRSSAKPKLKEAQKFVRVDKAARSMGFCTL